MSRPSEVNFRPYPQVGDWLLAALAAVSFFDSRGGSGTAGDPVCVQEGGMLLPAGTAYSKRRNTSCQSQQADNPAGDP